MNLPEVYRLTKRLSKSVCEIFTISGGDIFLINLFKLSVFLVFITVIEVK